MIFFKKSGRKVALTVEGHSTVLITLEAQLECQKNIANTMKTVTAIVVINAASEQPHPPCVFLVGAGIQGLFLYGFLLYCMGVLANVVTLLYSLFYNCLKFLMYSGFYLSTPIRVMRINFNLILISFSSMETNFSC